MYIIRVHYVYDIFFLEITVFKFGTNIPLGGMDIHLKYFILSPKMEELMRNFTGVFFNIVEVI